MRKLLIALLAFSIPSAHATNYVECEAIRAVISRNEIQKEKAEENFYKSYESKKVEEKYGEGNRDCFYDLSEPLRTECKDYMKSVWESKEHLKLLKATLDPHKEIAKRATNDFKKRGCYYF